MELVKVFQSGVALIFVLSSIAIVAIIIRKLNANKIAGFKITPKRIKILEIQHIDAKTKLLLIEKDSKEFFILKNEQNFEILEVKDVQK